MNKFNKLKILQHNVQAWTYNRRYELANYYAEEDPDVILINSHGLTNDNKIKLLNYDVYSRNTRNEYHDGAAIAVKRALKYTIGENNIDNYLDVTIQTTLGDICIATGYQPPRRPWLPLYNFQNWSRKTIPTYFIGDINARHQILGNNNRNPVGEAIQRMIGDGKYCHLGPDFKTFITNRTATTPDLILNNNNQIHNIYIQPGKITTSDHLPIIITLSAEPIQVPTTPTLDLKHANWDGFRSELNRVQYQTLDRKPADTIQTEMAEWFRLIQRGVENNIPTRRHKLLPHPVITPEIRALKQQYNTMANDPYRMRWTTQQRSDYTRMQARLQQAYKTARNGMWDRILTQIEGKKRDPKQFWTDIKKLMGTTTMANTHILDENGNKKYEPKDQEPVFRRHWKNVFKINDQDNLHYCQVTENRVLNELRRNKEKYEPFTTIDFSRLNPDNPQIKRITPYEVITTLKTFKNRKAPGASQINKEIMKNIPDNMINYLTDIYNASLSAGIFPKAFKHAIIKMLMKDGKSPTHVINYRPISLLETAGKIYEKIINLRLRVFMENNQLHNPHQHSYRTHRGTHTAIAMLYEQISNTQQNRDQCSIILRDVSKAFDKVWHPGMKLKIINLNLPRCMTSLLCNFLDDRTAAIKINSYMGETFQLEAGVPQGSALSPLLYNIYVRDIGDLTFSDYIQYADDITQIITYPGKSKQFMKLRTERAIHELNSYENRNKIQTNQSKFQILHASKHNPPATEVNNREIAFSQEVKALGLKITKHGISAHIKERKAKANRGLKKLRRFVKLEGKTKLHLYKALIQPILTYPPVPLNSISITSKKQLQVIQNKALRWIEADRPPYNTTVEQLHHKWKLEPLNVVTYKRAFNTWENIRNYLPEDYEKINTQEETNHKWWPKAIIGDNPTLPPPIYI